MRGWTRARAGLALALAASVMPTMASVSGAGAAAAVSRIAGSDRFDTAAKLSAATFPAGVAVAYIANGRRFPDALTGGAAAAKRGAPVLLVETTSIPDTTAAELRRLTPGSIVVLGGPNAVGPRVVSDLQAFTTGTVTRQAGADRYGTAADVSSKTFDPGVPTVYVALGSEFREALSGAAAAGSDRVPLVLVERDAIPAATATELHRLQPASMRILGGTDSISDATATQLATYTTGRVDRFSGQDRYDTANSVSAHVFASPQPKVFVVTGMDFPDGVAGAAAAGLAHAPLELVPNLCVPSATNAEISRLDPASIVILGGPNAVAPAVADRKPCPEPPTGNAACLAAVGHPVLDQVDIQYVQVMSNAPQGVGTSFFVHAPGGEMTLHDQTNAAGRTGAFFGIDPWQPGATVKVDIAVGIIVCHTAFKLA